MSKLLIPFLLIVTGVGIVIMFVVPAWQQYMVLKSDNNHLADMNTEIDGLTQKRDQLANEIARIPKDGLQRLDQVMPSAPQGPEFLFSVQKLVVSHGLKVVKLDLATTLNTKQKTPEIAPVDFVPTGQEGEAMNYKTLTVNLEINGQYEALKDFLREMESSVRIINVQSINLLPQENTFNIKMTLMTYYQ